MTSKLKTDILETVSGSGTIALTNQLSGMTHASMPSGSVLQVVHVKGSATDTTTTSTSYVASGLQASITPMYSNSKILVTFNSVSHANPASANQGVKVSIFRGGAEPSPTMRGGLRKQTGNWISASYSIVGLDSPNTTSSVTYEAYFKTISTTGYFLVDHVDSKPTLTLTEIKG